MTNRIQRALLASLVLALTACSSLAPDGADEAAGGHSGHAADHEASAQTSTSPDRDEDKDEPSLADFGFGATGGIDTDEANQLLISDAITQCMTANGWTYTPYPELHPSRLFAHSNSDGLEPGTSEYAEKWGFGISTLTFTQEEVGPDLIGHVLDEGAADYIANDPNQAYWSTLSEAEQEAYLQDLEAMDGCRPTATEEVLAEAKALENLSFAIVQEFEDEWAEIAARTDADPRVVDAENELIGCVAADGHKFTKPNDAHNDIDQRVSAIKEKRWEEMEEGDDTPPLSDEAKEELSQLQRYEIEVAVVFAKCGENDLNELKAKVQAENDQRFVNDNIDALNTMKSEHLHGS